MTRPCVHIAEARDTDPTYAKVYHRSNADPQFTRVHVFTVKDGEAEITAAGGIHLKMKLTRPNVYEGDYALGSMHMHYVADLAATPPTLDVSEKYLGCKWTAKKE